MPNRPKTQARAARGPESAKDANRDQSRYRIDRQAFMDRLGSLRRRIRHDVDELVAIHPAGLLIGAKAKAAVDDLVGSVPIGKTTVGEVARRRVERRAAD